MFGGANWTTSGEPNVKRMAFAGAYYKGVSARSSPVKNAAGAVRSRMPSVTTNRVMAASRSAMFGVAWNVMALRIPPT